MEEKKTNKKMTEKIYIPVESFVNFFVGGSCFTCIFLGCSFNRVLQEKSGFSCMCCFHWFAKAPILQAWALRSKQAAYIDNDKHQDMGNLRFSWSDSV